MQHKLPFGFVEMLADSELFLLLLRVHWLMPIMTDLPFYNCFSERLKYDASKKMNICVIKN